jgi:carboxylesterase type B
VSSRFFCFHGNQPLTTNGSYRVTIFGFPGGSAGDHNVGLLDQRLAVEWVRDNIAAFGGDPNRIILFGQSAGAASIDFYTYAWASDPIVTGFIEESGTTMVIPPLNTTFSEAIWSNISSKVGCASGDASAVLSCMRDANASSILAAIGSNKIAPTVDSSIVFNESEYTARSLAGNFIKKPLLLGNNDNENGIFRVGAILHNQPEPQAYWDKDNLQQFACPCAARGNVSVYNSVPTWRYHWFGVFPNTNLTTYPDSGAYHGSEIPIIFNTSPAGNGILPNTARELEVMNYTRGAWVAFAKDPVNGPKAYGWPEYDPTKATLVRLGLNDSASPDFALPQVYDAPCGTMFAVSSAGANGTNAGNSSAKVSGGDATVDRASWWTLMVVFSTLASFAILL